VPLAVTLKQVQEMPNTVTSLRSDVPDGVSELVLKLLAKQPRLRYQNAAQLIAAIDRLQNRRADSSRTTLFDFARAQFVGKRSSVALGIIAVCTVLVGVLALLIAPGLGASETAATPTPGQLPVATTTLVDPVIAPPKPSPTSAPRPTIPPSPTPPPQLIVTNEIANVRAGPSMRYDKVGELKKDEVVTVTGRSEDGEWLQIAFADGAGGRAWVKIQVGETKLVEPNEAAKTALVVVVPTLPAQALPAAQCTSPSAAYISFPQHGQTVRRELVVYGAADVPDSGYGKVEIFKNGGWAFVSEFRLDRSIGSELGRIRPPEFSSLNSGVLLLRVVTVDREGQEIASCQVSVIVSN
jgi:hypothetical protein